MVCGVRTACFEDIAVIKKIADNNKKEIGFILRSIFEASVRSSELLVAYKEGDEIVGFLRWHRRRDGWNTIYEICVSADFRGEGIGKHLLSKIQKPIRLKCPEDNKANAFYKHLGFLLVSIENGKKRKLNIWTLSA